MQFQDEQNNLLAPKRSSLPRRSRNCQIISDNTVRRRSLTFLDHLNTTAYRAAPCHSETARYGFTR